MNGILPGGGPIAGRSYGCAAAAVSFPLFAGGVLGLLYFAVRVFYP